MSEENSENSAQNRWKSRYYDTLDELEGKEKSWREVERLLRQLISRLTLAADTRHSILSKELTDLRNAVRDGRDILQLRDLIDNISEHVAELDKLRKKDRRQSHPALLISEIIEQIKIPQQLTREFRRLKKLAKGLDKETAADVMNAEFVTFLNEVIDPPPELEKESRRTKLLDRILSRNKETPATDLETNAQIEEQPTEQPVITETTNSSATAEMGDKPAEQQAASSRTPQKLVAPAVGELLLQLSLRMPDVVKARINYSALKKHTNRARTRKDLIAIVDVIAQQIEAAYEPQAKDIIEIDDDAVQAVSDAIKVFFAQMDPPTDLHERVCELEQFFTDRSDDMPSLVHCLNALAEVVAEICKRLAFQRDELEGFFVQLSTRLKDLDAGLQKTNEINEQGVQNNQNMDQAVHEEIDGIHDTIQNIEDIVQLKQGIQARIDAIDKHLSSFQEVESERLKTSEQQIKDLTEKIEKMETVSEHLRSRLEETQQQAYRDVLTGIPNRQAYEEKIAEEIARCRRYNVNLCLIVWDVDKFKTVNDTFGHAAGDKVLKVVAETLQAQIRETDFLARFGGEEFVLLLTETDVTATKNVAEKLREIIAETPFHFRDNRVPVTISGGIAQLEKDETANSLFERADKALYSAKENGRNRIEVAKKPGATD